MRRQWLVVLAVGLCGCEVGDGDAAADAAGQRVDGAAGDTQAPDRASPDTGRTPDAAGSADGSPADASPDRAVPDAQLVPDGGPADPDGDGRPTGADNCPEHPNPGQKDTDGDGVPDEADCASLNPARPSPEICDGIDSDCDGAVDEGVLNACGGCGAAPVEVCDDVDNDCDGSTDEGVLNACGGCGRPPAEVCDGADDDCDGRIDEGLPLNRCGVCGELPVELCNRLDDDCDRRVDEDALNACGGPCRPAPSEACNGADDDCDGTVDEGVQNACGACGPVPVEVCNGEDDDCDGVVDEDGPNACGGCGPVPVEVCDGLDNDCDGVTDEDGPNACGGCGDVPAEVCDGADNDCDGVTDEGLPLNACGRCGRLPAEVCDGVDNDCDGAVDERLAGRVDDCDGLDSDCDGVTDEDSVAFALQRACEAGEGEVQPVGCAGPQIIWPRVACPEGPALLPSWDALPGGWFVGQFPAGEYHYEPNGGDGRLDQWASRVEAGEIRGQAFGGPDDAVCTWYDYDDEGRITGSRSYDRAPGDYPRSACYDFDLFDDCSPFRINETSCIRAGDRVVEQTTSRENGCLCNGCWGGGGPNELIVTNRLLLDPDGEPRCSMTRARSWDSPERCTTRFALRDADGRVLCQATGTCGGDVTSVVRYRYDRECWPEDQPCGAEGPNACGECGPPPEEACNGADDDCDGAIDEGVQNACGGCGPLAPEVCDGVDNDCDGATDERSLGGCWSGRPGLCGVGLEVCGDPDACEPSDAEPDVCDGADNDCDGVVDEGGPGGCGGCGERCNGVDDDCDGLADEGLPPGECGICGEEECNGVDDDCDGLVDEGCRTQRLRAACEARAGVLVEVDGCEGPAVEWPIVEDCQRGPERLQGLDERPIEQVLVRDGQLHLRYSPGLVAGGWHHWGARLDALGQIVSQTVYTRGRCAEYDYDAAGRVVASRSVEADAEPQVVACSESVFAGCGTLGAATFTCAYAGGRIVRNEWTDTAECRCPGCMDALPFIRDAFGGAYLELADDGQVEAHVTYSGQAPTSLLLGFEDCQARLVLRDAAGRVVCDASGGCGTRDRRDPRVTRYRYDAACDGAP